ncbi:MAG: helix-turn-helix domain-containing protein [Actinomycetes bacterium]
MDVVHLHWPSDESVRTSAARDGQPRLLLVDPASSPPACPDLLEDWVRMPESEGEIAARSANLLARWARQQSTEIHLDDDGLLHLNGAWVSLPPVEARLMSALIDRLGVVVSRDQLGRSGWPAGVPGRNALDVHLLRLRRRTQSLDLSIRTIRSRGYILEVVRSDTRESAGMI